MTRLKLFRNPRLVTIVLLVLTLVLAGVIVAVAIALQKKSTAPGGGKAEDCDVVKNTTYGVCCQREGCSDANWQARQTCTQEADSAYNQCIASGAGTPTPAPSQLTFACNTYIDEFNTQSPTCSSGQVKSCTLWTKPGECSSDHKNTTNNYAITCGACATGTPSPAPTVTPSPASTTGWLPGFTCRHVTGEGECATAEFTNCKPGDNQMCFCNADGLSRNTDDGKQWSYGTTQLRDINWNCNNPQKSCAEAGPGLHNASVCNNPFRCPAAPIPSITLPPAPSPTGTIPPSSGGGGSNPSPTPSPVAISCDGISVKNANGQEIPQGTALTPGQTVTLSVASTNTKRIGTRYAFNDGSGYSVIENTQDANSCASKGTNFNDQYAPTTITFKVPTTATAGSTVSFSSANIFKVASPGVLSTTTATACPDNDATNVVSCGGSSLGIRAISGQGNTLPQASVIDPVTGEKTQNAHTYDVSRSSEIQNSLRISCTQTTSCARSFTIAATTTQTPTATPTQTPTATPTVTTTTTSTPTTSTPVCTGITVTPSTGIKQGDTVTVNVTGTNVNKYRLDTNFGYTSNGFGTQSSFSVAIPTDRQLSNISIRGTVSDGTTTDTNNNCIFSYTFENVPNVTKTINTSGSSGLSGSAPNYIVNGSSTVKYDLTVRNDGQNILQNVIAVDKLTSYDPQNNNTAVTPAIGDIQTATNLGRTTGTKSTPSTVAPRVPSGNGPYAAGVKSVEWTKIDKLYPGERYTGSITVDVLSYTGTPILRNTVCLYQDTNNNGQYDEGTDTQLRCDHVDVYTSQPQFTITKQALELNSTTAVQVVKPGDTFRYVLTLTNTSTSSLDLTNVTVTDTFDSTFVSKFNLSEISDSGTLSGNVITWDDLTGSLAAGATKTVSFQAQLKSDFFSGNTNCTEVVTNNVTARSTSPNYTTANYQVDVTANNDSCAPTPTLAINSLPPTGFITGDNIKFLGLLFVIMAIAIYITTSRRRNLHLIRMAPATRRPISTSNSLNDKLSDIISRLKE